MSIRNSKVECTLRAVLSRLHFIFFLNSVSTVFAYQTFAMILLIHYRECVQLPLQCLDVIGLHVYTRPVLPI